MGSNKSNEDLEYFEWDNLWFDNAPDRESDSVLVIGDSISCGYRIPLSKIADGRYLVDGLGTSKAVNNGFFPTLIDYFISQTSNLRVIMVNNGLHGWSLSEAEYETHFDKLVGYISKKCPYAKLVMATTTPVRRISNLNEFEGNYSRVTARNEIALRLAEKYNMTVCDMFSVIKDRPDLYTQDGVHLLEEGYELLAKHAAAVIDGLI